MAVGLVVGRRLSIMEGTDDKLSRGPFGLLV